MRKNKSNMSGVSKYKDIVDYVESKDVSIMRLSDALVAYDIIINHKKIPIPLENIDDTMATVLDVYYHYMDSSTPHTMEEVVEGYEQNYETFGCDPVSNYNFVQDSARFMRDDISILEDTTTIEACAIETIDIDDEREWED